jgi:hypothetical protein
MRIAPVKMFVVPAKAAFGLAIVAVLSPVSTSIARAQATLGGVSAGSSISSSMSGMSASGSLAAGSNMRRSADGMRAGASSDLTESPELFGSGGSGGEGMSGAGAAAPPPPMKPRIYGRTSGSALLSELLAGRRITPIPSPIGGRRSPSAQANLSRSIKKMTPAQRQRLVMKKYDIRPKNWLVHYLKEDRHKISSGLWSYLTTRTSRFYYRPWSAAMLKADPNHVIGFRTWQDAMLAGYRPDPVSRPEPAPQIADLARYTRSDAFYTYVEFVYAGQVPPTVFKRNYDYLTQVARIVGSHAHTKPYVTETVDKVILAAMGRGPLPTSVGAPTSVGPPMTPGGEMGSGSMMSSGSGSMSSGSSPGGSGSGIAALQAGNTDRRTDDFNTFSSRAGSLANVPANQR